MRHFTEVGATRVVHFFPRGLLADGLEDDSRGIQASGIRPTGVPGRTAALPANCGQRPQVGRRPAEGAQLRQSTFNLRWPDADSIWGRSRQPLTATTTTRRAWPGPCRALVVQIVGGPATVQFQNSVNVFAQGTDGTSRTTTTPRLRAGPSRAWADLCPEDCKYLMTQERDLEP